MVDKEVKEFPYLSEDVEDYQVVFNFSGCKLDYGFLILLWAVLLKATRLTVDESDLYSLGELEFLVGEYVRADKRMYEIVFDGEDTGEIYKHLRFRLESN